jgi:hypothetical protein
VPLGFFASFFVIRNPKSKIRNRVRGLPGKAGVVVGWEQSQLKSKKGGPKAAFSLLT